jgi:PhnB protein
MKNKKIMATINPHINFNGNAEEAFTFYKSVFGGEFAKIIRFKDIAGPEFPVVENEAHKIMHIALPRINGGFRWPFYTAERASGC